MKTAIQIKQDIEKARLLKEKREREHVARCQAARRGEIVLGFFERRKLKKLMKHIETYAKYAGDDGIVWVDIDSIIYRHYGGDYEFWNNYCAFQMEQLGYINVELQEHTIGDRWWGIKIKAKLPSSPAEQILFSSKGS